MIDTVVNALNGLDPVWVYVVVGLLAFAEAAIFVGFVLPGETAVVVGGVLASQSRVDLVALLVLVPVAAVVGDSVGFEVGRFFGSRLLRVKLLDKYRKRIDEARDLIRRRGPAAVFLGRFIAFFRAVMPALAGTSGMSYRKFLVFNVAGGVVWGVGFTLLGYAAGSSYKRIEHLVGTWAAIGIGAIVVVAVGVWLVRRRIREHRQAAG